jgi:uncharacterized protein
MPNGKPAGVRCIHLTPDYRCGIFTDPARPTVCEQFQADIAVCGGCREDALRLLDWLEQATG